MMRHHHDIRQRDDGLYDVITGDNVAGPFPTIAFAQQIASGHLPALVQMVKFHRLQIREVRNVAS